MKKLYELTDGDKLLFEASRDNPNLFTDFYMFGETTGTYWLPGAKSGRWRDAYDILKTHWLSRGEPASFVLDSDGYTRTIQVRRNRLAPIFFHNHGFIFLPWYIEMRKQPQEIFVVVGGYGCLASSQTIYDVERKESIPVGDLHRDKRAPVVLAWTGWGFTAVRASVPFIKGCDQILEITTRSGRQMRVTPSHAVLSQRAWIRAGELEPGDQLVASSLSLPGCDGEAPGLPPDDGHYSGIAPDSQSGYRLGHRFYDEPLRLAPGVVQGVIPSPDDAVAHSLLRLQLDGLGREPGRSPIYPASSRPSRKYSERLASDLKDSWAYNPTSISFDAQPRHEPEAVGHQRFPGMSAPGLVFPESGPYRDPEQTSMAYASSLAVTSYIVPDEIVSIKVIGEEEFYDLHVPVWNNYYASGFIHHNSGKTLNEAMDVLVDLATIPGFSAVWLAPSTTQAVSAFRDIMKWLYRTRYQERFLLNASLRAAGTNVPTIRIGNDYVGFENTLAFYSILDNVVSGVDKLETLTLDRATIDQAEKVPNIEEVVRVVGSRFRGMFQDRIIEGKMTFLANAKNNIQLWELYDEAESDPERVYAYSPSTDENPYVTDEQLSSIEKHVVRLGANEAERKEAIRVFMKGGRPKGGGTEFTEQMLDRIYAPWLDEMMDEGLEQGLEGYVKEERPKIGVVRWELPPKKEAKYLVVADGGTANPPYRNSPPVAAFDITNFPKEPAYLWAFHWVDGNGSSEPWMNRYYEYVMRYPAIYRNCFDGTGPQAGMVNWVKIFKDIMADPMNLGADRKFIALNAGKMLCERGLLGFPDIQSIFMQLGTYVVPEPDKKFRQDLVMMIVIAAAWLERMFYQRLYEDETEEQLQQRNQPPNRYERLREPRYTRSRIR